MGATSSLLLILRYQLRDPVLLRPSHVIQCQTLMARRSHRSQDLIDLLIHVLVAALHRSLYPLGSCLITLISSIRISFFLCCFYPFIIPTCLPLGKLFASFAHFFYKVGSQPGPAPANRFSLPAGQRISARPSVSKVRSRTFSGLTAASRAYGPQDKPSSGRFRPPPPAARLRRPVLRADRSLRAMPPGRSVAVQQLLSTRSIDHPHHCTLSSECLPIPLRLMVTRRPSSSCRASCISLQLLVAPRVLIVVRLPLRRFLAALRAFFRACLQLPHIQPLEHHIIAHRIASASGSLASSRACPAVKKPSSSCIFTPFGRFQQAQGIGHHRPDFPAAPLPPPGSCRCAPSGWVALGTPPSGSGPAAAGSLSAPAPAPWRHPPLSRSPDLAQSGHPAGSRQRRSPR